MRFIRVGRQAILVVALVIVVGAVTACDDQAATDAVATAFPTETEQEPVAKTEPQPQTAPEPAQPAQTSQSQPTASEEEPTEPVTQTGSSEPEPEPTQSASQVSPVEPTAEPVRTASYLPLGGQYREALGGLGVSLNSTEGQSSGVGGIVEVLSISGLSYPKYQFWIADNPADNCKSAHWHADVPVYPLEPAFPAITDPDPFGCGFGLVGEVPELSFDVTDFQAAGILVLSGEGPELGETFSSSPPEPSVTSTSSGEDDGDNPRDTPPPQIFGEEIDHDCNCGPDVTDLLLDSLKRINERVQDLPDSEKGIIDGTAFLHTNGINIDLQPKPKRDEDNNIICPGPKCTAPDGQKTVMICGVCVMSHIANDILFGFTANQLEVPFSIQLLGAHYAEVVSYGSLDPLASQGAYKMGNNVSDQMGPDGSDMTPEEMCTTLRSTTLRIGFMDAPEAFDLMKDEQSFLEDCVECQAPGETEALKDFSTTDWTLDDGSKATYDG